MKKVVLTVFALLMLSSAAMAFSPDSSYVALFVDTLRTGHRVDYGGSGVTAFEMWIWWLPSVRGIQAAEFKITYPSSIIQGSVTGNDSLAIQFGNLGTGIAVTWIYCQRDWTWSHYQLLYLRNATQGQIQLVAAPPPTYEGKFQVGTCELGSPLEPVRRLHQLCLNYDCGVAVHEKTWGAIKDLYR